MADGKKAFDPEPKPTGSAGVSPASEVYPPVHACLFNRTGMSPEVKIEMERFCRKLLRGNEEYVQGSVVKNGVMSAAPNACWYQECFLDGGTWELVSLNNDLHQAPYHALFEFYSKLQGPGGRLVQVGRLRADIEKCARNYLRKPGKDETADPDTGAVEDSKKLSDEEIRRYKAAFGTWGTGASPVS